MDSIKTLLDSNRVKALLLLIGLAFLQKNYPDIAPSLDEMKWIYSGLITFIVGDTLRPVDPSKPNALAKTTTTTATTATPTTTTTTSVQRELP